MVDQYPYERLEKHVLQDAYFSQDADGKLQFEKKDRGEVRYHPFVPMLEDLLIAYHLLRTGQPMSTPSIVIGRSPRLTNDDVAAMLQLDNARLAALGALTRRLREIDLALPSDRLEAEHLLQLAKQYAETCFTAAKLEWTIAAAVTAGDAAAANGTIPQDGYFDGWGEGPFSAAEVSRFLQQSPRRAKEFHLSDGRTYADVTAAGAKSGAPQNELPPERSSWLPRAIHWTYDTAAVVALFFTWVTRHGK